jgi:hypothetical protein
MLHMLKLLLEIILALVLHPIAFILCLINIARRDDLRGVWMVVWIIVTIIWGIGPILYVLFGGGEMW